MSPPSSPPPHPPPPPPWAHPTHTLQTPHLIIRTANPIPDHKPFTHIRSHPLNSEFGGVVNSTISEERQLASLTRQLDSTKEGKNCFLVVVLREDEVVRLRKEKEGRMGKEEWEREVEWLRVEDGVLIGMTGFNYFALKALPDETSSDEKRQILHTDVGVLIHHTFTRQGYAKEALVAVIEYGFSELGVGVLTMETNACNKPWREMMRGMGFGEGEVGWHDEGHGKGEESVKWSVKLEEWENVKTVMTEMGLWVS